MNKNKEVQLYCVMRKNHNNTFSTFLMVGQSNEDAMNKYFAIANIKEEEKSAYLSCPIAKSKKEETFLKKAGFESWTEYDNVLHPTGPITL